MSENESQFLSVLRVWAAVAWADGKIADAEAVAMKRLIATAQLTDEERETALTWLDNKVELETDKIANLTVEARRGIYRAALRLATVDLDFSDDEKVFLNNLRDGLSLTDEDVATIEASLGKPPESD